MNLSTRRRAWGSPAFDLSAGELCLDFTNTIDSRGDITEEDKLGSYPDLLAWGVQAGVLTVESADDLKKLADGSPEKAAKTLAIARRVREAIFRVCSAAAAGHPSRPADLATLNPALKSALSQARVLAIADGYQWGWSEARALDRVLWPVLRSAAQLLTGDSLALVGECQARGCKWLFLDTSRNQRRRWCDMKSCGNREKARRHYQRSRQSSAPDAS